ncbi:hypothetical protein DsansV1_C32g0220981 [Dioscorea sansibarensis]
MTTKRRERSIKDLYGVTEMISKPEITPVLEGSCHIQGPVDELEDGLQQTDCVTLPAEKGYMIVNQTTRTRVESGTCNGVFNRIRAELVMIHNMQPVKQVIY